MKILLPVFAAFFMFTFSQQTFAQSGAQTENVDIRMSKEQSIKSIDHQKKIENEQSKIENEQKKIEKEQKRINNHQKEIERSEKAIEKTKKKIVKGETANKKIIDKANDKSLTEESIISLNIKSKKQELEIQKLKLKLLEQEKELEKVRSDF